MNESLCKCRLFLHIVGKDKIKNDYNNKLYIFNRSIQLHVYNISMMIFLFQILALGIDCFQ